MAKANIEVDTETGDMSVSVNGKKVDKVERIYASKYMGWDYESNTPKPYSTFEVCVYDKDDSGVVSYTKLMASDCDAVKASKEVYAKDEKYPEFVKVSSVTKAQADIANAMRR